MIMWIARYRGKIIEIGCPALVTVADVAIGILGVKCRVVAAHGPCRLAINILDLKNAVALVAARAFPCSGRAQVSIGSPVPAIVLLPVRFLKRLSAQQVCIDAPVAGDPLENLIGGSGEVPGNVFPNAIGLGSQANIRPPGGQPCNLLRRWHALVGLIVIGLWFPGGALNTGCAGCLGWQLTARWQGCKSRQVRWRRSALLRA